MERLSPKLLALPLGLALCLVPAVSSAGQDHGAPLAETPAVAHAEEVAEAFKAVAAHARPSVARIVGFIEEGGRTGEVSGSGFVIKDGYLVTNNHVVSSVNHLVVEMAGQPQMPAEVVGTDPLTDIAVLHVKGLKAPVLQWADDQDIQVGEWVVAIGFPLGLDQTVTAGIVSATNRKLNIVGSSSGIRGYEDFIQTDAAINKGNSGGPLLNLRGQVVGVNSAIVTQTGGSDGLGFAIPTKLAEYIANQLIAHGEVTRGLIGVNLQPLTPALSMSYGLPEHQIGALINYIDPGTGAAKAGLLPEDIITMLDHKPVKDVDDLRNTVAMMSPGTSVDLQVMRHGQPMDFTIELGRMKTGASPSALSMNEGGNSQEQQTIGGRIGFVLQDMTVQEARQSGNRDLAVRVYQVVPGSAAQLVGIKEDDLITRINSQPLQTTPYGPNNYPSAAKWLQDTLNQAKPGESLRFTIKRPIVTGMGQFDGYQTLFIGVQIPQ